MSRRAGARAAPAEAPLSSSSLRGHPDGVSRCRQHLRRTRRLVTIWSSCQVVHWLRREASTVLIMPEARIRCVALDVGGGFGVKATSIPRNCCIPFLARAVDGRCDGSKTGTNISCAPAIRATKSTMSRPASTTKDGCWHSATASSPTAAPGIRSAPASPTTPPCICPALQVRQFRRPCADRRHQQGAERALPRRRTAGGDFAMERVMDLIAGELGLDPADVRMRNMIPQRGDALSSRDSVSRRRDDRLR